MVQTLCLHPDERPYLFHRRDAEDAERGLFSRAVERTAREKNISPPDINNSKLKTSLHISSSPLIIARFLFAFRPLSGRQKNIFAPLASLR